MSVKENITISSVPDEKAMWFEQAKREGLSFVGLVRVAIAEHAGKWERTTGKKSVYSMRQVEGSIQVDAQEAAVKRPGF